MLIHELLQLSVHKFPFILVSSKLFVNIMKITGSTKIEILTRSMATDK